MLPNFLGIGAVRSGTTWLDTQLRSHPEIYLPTRRKEVNFFDKYYDRGPDWYQKFFPSPEQASKYRAIGEITPSYLYDPNAPARIREYIHDCRFIVIVRNPVERAYSEYGFHIRNYNEKQSFRDFLSRIPDAFARGLYGEQLKRYMQYFPIEKFLILIFERSFSDPACALRRLADYLSIGADQFSYYGVERKVLNSYYVRFSRLHAIVQRFARYLRKKDVDWIVNTAKALGVPWLFGNRGMIPHMDAEIRAELLSKYEADISLLESILGEDLSLWR